MLLRRLSFAAIGIALLAGAGGSALAAETPLMDRILQLAQAGNLPKGSYQQSCTCFFSGGVTLMCNCANPQGRMFQSNLDIRNCPPPKDIKNCSGNLSCVGKGEECR